MIMPTISRKLYRLYNLKVEIRFIDHNPPHMHITSLVDDINWMIDLNGELRKGSIKTKKQQKLFKIVEYWMEVHKDDLWDRWYKAVNSMMVDYID